MFWKMLTPDGSLVAGAINEISLTTHTLDSCVGTETGTMGMGQTSRVLLNGVRGNWVEVGWGQQSCSTGPCFNAFIEDGINGAGYYQARKLYSCLKPNTWQYWDIHIGQFVTITGSTMAIGFLDCEDGQGWRLVGNVDAFGAFSGWGEGEGFHRGSSAMGQVHRNLQYQDSAGAWHPAAGVSCSVDQDSYWDGLKKSTTEFWVVPESSGVVHSCYTSR